MPDDLRPVSKPMHPAGEMAARVAAHDWSKTPLGPRESWSPSLKLIVSTILATQFPMALRWGPQFVIIYNDGYLPILGEKHPEALGRCFREIWPEVQDQLGSLHHDLLSGVRQAMFAEDLLLRIRRRGANMEDAFFTVSYSPVPDETSPTGTGGILITAVETTKRVAAERALRERQNELARVQEIGQVGGVEVDLADHLRTHRSPEYLRIHGLPPDTTSDTHEDWARRIHPEDRDATLGRFFESINGDAREYRSEYRIIRPSDGQVRWIHVRAEIERAADGKPLRLVGAHIDVTERRRAEEALRKLNETLEQQVAERTRERDRLWRVSDDLIGVADFKGYWTAINPAASAILGWSEAELLAMSIASLWHPDDVAATLAYRDQLVHGGPTVRFQNRYRHKDGSYRWLSWSSTAEDGFIYALARDVTAERNAAEALRRTEEQLRQSQKMEAIGQLTGGIAHDFNNLLTGVIGSLDLMQKRIAQKRFADVERYATLATTSANRAAALTHRLLAFARRQPLDPKPVNVNQLVHSIEELLRRTIGETIQLDIRAADGLWATFCDPHQLESALLNLVINSRDAMPGGGKLTIETANADLDNVEAAALRDVAPGQYVCLSVTDTGVGMAPAVRGRAFDPFFTTKPLGQGTGLGLSMVYGFAHQSEGQARIESEVAQGTSVALYLPRYRGSVEEAAAVAAADASAKAHDGETVLVIEDEASVRELVVEVLHDLGYRALEAGDGPSGLKILQSPGRIDLLVSDIGLPGMNGRQVAEAAREQRPDLKILFITGYAENAAMANGFLDPGMEMVTKPFAVDALAARIRDMIGT
ncbi:MAG: PAS domain S-box protein [Alphaproteobacteria bacterium]|nr:MAG: PAS domain S-box protein [Alphaproteobacteria bacterium]